MSVNTLSKQTVTCLPSESFRRGVLQSRIVVPRDTCNVGDGEIAQLIASELGISSVIAEILVSRGVATAKDARTFLSPSLRDDLPDPSNIKNIEVAAKLLLSAIEENKRITVFSDFDVDGITSAAQLVLFLKAINANVSHYIPDRFSEGYGVNESAVRELAKSGTQVLISVDCGISDVRAFTWARRFGLQSIIIDHHQVHELPPADVIVNPAQDDCPFKEHHLAAAGLVWMFIIVFRRLILESWKDKVASDGLVVPNPKEFLDLAAVGTICDLVPLTKLNRVIAHRGIEAIKTTQRIGLVALKEIAGVQATPRFGGGQVGFALGPRLNAAGRLGDVNQAFELLVTEDSLRAKTLARSVDKMNSQRRTTEEAIRSSCENLINLNPGMLEHKALAIFGQEFHLGIVGIVAQRLVERFYVPTVIMAPAEHKTLNGSMPVIKGSIRGISGFHVADMLKQLQDILIGFGGHAQAGGVTLSYDNLEIFKERFVTLADRVLTDDDCVPKLFIDKEVKLSDVDFQLAHELSLLAPFGIGNPSPVLFTRDVIVDSITSLTGGHLKVRLTDGKCFCGAVIWGCSASPTLRKGNKIDIAYSPEINSYKGVSSVQLNVKEIWSSL